MVEDGAEEAAGRCRLDKWLWCTRFYKTRSLAAQAVTGGKAHLNAVRVKPAHGVKPGDQVSIMLGGVVADFSVVSLPARRGPADEAQLHYRETEASRLRREQFREQHRLAQLSRPSPDTRPDKRERRELRRLQRSQ